MSTPSEIPFQHLVDALLDESISFHPRFLYRLSDLNSNEAVLLRETWPRVPQWRRQALLEDLEQLGESDFLLSFEAIGRLALDDSDPAVRTLAIRLLWEFDTFDLIPAFLDMIETDADSAVRSAAALALGRFVYLGEIGDLPEEKLREIEDRLLRVVASDPVADVRRRALEAVSYSSREEIPPLIELAFASGEEAWVAAALQSMGNSADERWAAKINASLTSRNPILRAEAARAAGGLELSQATPQLIQLTRDSDDEVRLAAIWALSQTGGSSARATLERLWEKVEDEAEAELIQNALDNLAFNEEAQPFSFPRITDEKDFDFDREDLLIGDEEDYLDLAADDLEDSYMSYWEDEEDFLDEEDINIEDAFFDQLDEDDGRASADEFPEIEDDEDTLY